MVDAATKVIGRKKATSATLAKVDSKERVECNEL
jgi:hypothetical protein